MADGVRARFRTDVGISITGISGPEADELRIDLTLVSKGGHWRVSEVNVLQAPPVASPTTTTTAPTGK